MSRSVLTWHGGAAAGEWQHLAIVHRRFKLKKSTIGERSLANDDDSDDDDDGSRSPPSVSAHWPTMMTMMMTMVMTMMAQEVHHR